MNGGAAGQGSTCWELLKGNGEGETNLVLLGEWVEEPCMARGSLETFTVETLVIKLESPQED